MIGSRYRCISQHRWGDLGWLDWKDCLEGRRRFKDLEWVFHFNHLWLAWFWRFHALEICHPRLSLRLWWGSLKRLSSAWGRYTRVHRQHYPLANISAWIPWRCVQYRKLMRFIGTLGRFILWKVGKVVSSLAYGIGQSFRYLSWSPSLRTSCKLSGPHAWLRWFVVDAANWRVCWSWALGWTRTRRRHYTSFGSIDFLQTWNCNGMISKQGPFKVWS